MSFDLVTFTRELTELGFTKNGLRGCEYLFPHPSAPVILSVTYYEESVEVFTVPRASLDTNDYERQLKLSQQLPAAQFSVAYGNGPSERIIEAVALYKTWFLVA